MKHTYLLIAALPSCSACYWTYLKSPQKNFRRRLYKFLCLKLWGHWTESHQISTRCTEMIADYSAEMKIAIFQSVSECHGDEWRSSSNSGKNCTFKQRKLQEYWTQKFKFVHHEARILPFNLLKADLRSANPFLNAEVRSKGRTWRCLWPSSKFNWLP